MKINIGKAIIAINTNSSFSITNEDINNIEWYDNNPTGITNQQILAKQSELQSAEDNKEIIKEQNKQSALTKLSALGLTEAEIKSIIGNN
jgi:hypothetical protein